MLKSNALYIECDHCSRPVEVTGTFANIGVFIDDRIDVFWIYLSKVYKSIQHTIHHLSRFDRYTGWSSITVTNSQIKWMGIQALPESASNFVQLMNDNENPAAHRSCSSAVIRGF